MKVLVVDDHVAVGNSVKRTLVRVGHEVRLVHSVEEAIAALVEEEFSLVISDVMLGAETGADLHRWLKVNQPLLARTIVFITGGIYIQEVDTYIRESGALVLRKPFMPHDLLGGLREAMSDVQ